MHIELLGVQGFYAASYGARLSYAGSIDKMDTPISPMPTLGEKDCKLLSTLVKRGNDHAKAVRLITVSFLVRAPIKWLIQLDQYKVGTVSCSSSTMHSIMYEPFSREHFTQRVSQETIALCNDLRDNYLSTKNREYYNLLLDNLPNGYLYERVMGMNYQVLRSIYKARQDHKLDYWHTFCQWVETLPYAYQLIIV